MERNTLAIVKRLELSKVPLMKAIATLQKKLEDFDTQITANIANKEFQLKSIDAAIETLTKRTTLNPSEDIKVDLESAPITLEDSFLISDEHAIDLSKAMDEIDPFKF